MLEWSDELSVGLNTIDKQHKELFLRINDLVAAINQKTCKQEIGDVVTFLGDYITFHFGEEERFMQEYDYPGYIEHKSQHDQFRANFLKLERKLSALEGGKNPGSYDLSVETNQVVVDWILDHIINVDIKLGKFLSFRMSKSKVEQRSDST